MYTEVMRMRLYVLCSVALCAGCSAAPYTRYRGELLPPLRSDADLPDLPIREVPDGYRVVGVVSSRCDQEQGFRRCTRGYMKRAMARRAVAAGGTALLDLVCRRSDTSRLECDDDGGTTIVTTEHHRCVATVLRDAETPDVGRPLRVGDRR